MKGRSLAKTGCRMGSPMGGGLATAPDGKAASFLLHAAGHPAGTGLDRSPDAPQDSV